MSTPERSDRRRFKRIKKHFILTYFDLTAPAVKHDASQLKDISLGGICFLTSTPFSPGVQLGVELKTPFFAELTHLEGTVLQSQEKIKNIIYEVHMEFNTLSAQARFILSKIIKHFEEQKRAENE
ncbi:MAG: PilZ domain-containing protein [Candidatus Omnitrophica bacterium]|nr:PilZ domain-containing protein [Candidatus Omnitrophota bacterium]